MTRPATRPTSPRCATHWPNRERASVVCCRNHCRNISNHRNTPSARSNRLPRNSPLSRRSMDFHKCIRVRIDDTKHVLFLRKLIKLIYFGKEKNIYILMTCVAQPFSLQCQASCTTNSCKCKPIRRRRRTLSRRLCKTIPPRRCPRVRPAAGAVRRPANSRWI